MGNGRLIVIDGTDGSGKKTQTQLLIERMRREGQPVETISFPRYDRPGSLLVRWYLAGRFGMHVGAKTASIFFAIDRFFAKRRLRDWLAAGRHVVLDRYAQSNMGHQGGKIADPDRRADFFRWNDRLEFGLLGLPRPDLTLILRVPAEIGYELAKKRDETSDIHQADLNHLKNAEAAYLQMTETLPACRRIDCVENGALLSREAIHERVWAETSRVICIG